MAKVFHRKAGKDYPAHGIKKGDMYYTADIMTGPRSSRTVRSLTYPKRSQLTSSAFLQTVYELDERIGDIETLEDLRQYADDIREAGAMAQESFDNMPEGLQQGETGQLLEERVSECDSWADEVDAACDDIESHDDWEDAEIERQTEIVTEAIQGISCPF